ncbi:CPBP family intramembrane metalloprotease [Yangia mangrovi]|uniref:CPBP family intramembrane metalloprotease n=1 Tax=Alloyangia mangrovi TaxID=1779329 RepID=A0ABT2KPK8_9RHOB|nr:CPBP family intramembrane glutamic endopeptidase [Alloyangia mangrovi]MCT4372041.1 CPBP family intramembrane metalloprotease [Alloyangia mangrovi]
MPLTEAPSGSKTSASGLTILLVGWVTVTIFGAKVFHPSPQPLQDLLTSTLAWQVLLAGVLLTAVITWGPGWQEVGFRRPRRRDLPLLWFPVLVLAVILGLAALMGLPPAGVTLLVLANTLLVGFSEEAMFRGLLFHGLRARVSIWPAILWTSGLFGAVHLLNGFVTGDFGPALVQAAMAACTGLFSNGDFPAHRIALGFRHLPRALGLRDFHDRPRVAAGHGAATGSRGGRQRPADAGAPPADIAERSLWSVAP